MKIRINAQKITLKSKTYFVLVMPITLTIRSMDTVITVVAVVLLRDQFVPESFGDLGHYRANAITEIEALDHQYAGADVCTDCHDEQDELKRSSYHRGLACETCHGAAAKHAYADDPEEMTPLLPTSREACLQCHRYMVSRPTGFAQVFSELHNARDLCINCHDPHDPTPPEVPESCAGCHTGVARMKAVSHHATLECETCHEAAPEHRERPRAYLPKKPTNREFCGGCHAKGADSSREIPRIDLGTHGGRYVCWQCHYPHYPEGS